MLLGIRVPLWNCGRKENMVYVTLFTIGEDFRKSGLAQKLIAMKHEGMKQLESVCNYSISKEKHLPCCISTKIYLRPTQFTILESKGFEMPGIASNFRRQRTASNMYYKIPTTEQALKDYAISTLSRERAVTIDVALRKRFELCIDLENWTNIQKVWLIQKRSKQSRDDDYCIFSYRKYRIGVLKHKNVNEVDCALITFFFAPKPSCEWLNACLKWIVFNDPDILVIYAYHMGQMNEDLLSGSKFLLGDKTHVCFDNKDYERIPLDKMMVPVL